MKKILGGVALFAAIGCLATVSVQRNAEAADDASKAAKKAKPSPIGAWFGIARPCPPPAGDTSPEHASFCQAVCGQCPAVAGALPPEVPMMPTLLADGTVLADDAGELGVYHTTAHGKWTLSINDDLPNRPGTDRYKATFFWLGQNDANARRLDNAVRPRFVTYFDPKDPDRMIGFIQPHFFSLFPPGFATNGIVNVIPASPADQLSSNHIPAVDPMGNLPKGCISPTAGGSCLGTYHFVIRRVLPE